MEHLRAKYFSSNDYAYGVGIERIETIEVQDFSAISINDAIEFHQINKYLSDGCRLKRWSEEDYKMYQEKSKKLFGLTARFFKALNDSTIVREYQMIEHQYVDVFWELFEHFTLFDKISSDVFEKIQESENFLLSIVLEKKRIVGKYGIAIKKHILEHLQYAELIIRFSEQDDYVTDQTKIHLPSELSGTEIVDFLDRYLDSDVVNTNYVNSIFYMQETPRIPVTLELRLKAKRRYNTEVAKQAKNGFSYETKFGVRISKSQKTEKMYEQEGNAHIVSLSHEYLLYTLDYPSILNNFIYMLEYVDVQMRSNHANTSSKGTVLERAFGSKLKRHYKQYHGMEAIRILAKLELQSYYTFLSENGVRLEDVLNWFYSEYVHNEFGCPKMRVKFPSAQSTPHQKCSDICTTIENVMKQFALFAKKHEIDFELLSLMKGSQKINQIPSLVKGKYVYGKGTEYNSFTHMLFSNQSMMSFVERIYKQKPQLNTLYDLLSNEKVYFSEYNEGHQQSILYLSSYDLIRIADDGQICFGDRDKIFILKDLYNHDVISRWWYPKSLQHIFDEWLEQGLLREGNTLFSEPESDYLCYLLNHEKFTNGPDIRNKYLHGNQQIIENDDEHLSNYNILLQVMILLTIKINDELCLYESSKKGD